jgi:hypothetical protein
LSELRSESSDTQPALSEAEVLRLQVEKIRRSGVLGRPGLLSSLFDFLYQCSISGRSPKEIDVAIEAFGRDATFDVTQDALVRVYVHKLRRKLDEYYGRPGSRESARVVLPKGEYRLGVESAPSAVSASVSPLPAGVLPSVAGPPSAPGPPSSPVSPSAEVSPAAARQRQLPFRWLLAVLLISLAVNALFVAKVFSPTAHSAAAVNLRGNPLWARLLEDGRPIVIVVGDYYIFGETDQSMEVRRLIREFSVNSRDDLLRYLEQHPEKVDDYENLDLTYLPSSIALALKDIAPVLASRGAQVTVMLGSELNPDVFRSAHVVYVGYLSGLGMLQDVVFTGSRLSVGESYDELVDRKSGTHYFSGVRPPPGEAKYHDFSYFSTFPGPNGNQIVVIAGMRDAGLAHAAETVTSPAGLQQLQQQSTARTNAFEALYEVFGLSRSNMNARLVLTNPLEVTHIWQDTPR